MTRGASGERGTTLVELLTSTLFVSLLAAMSYSFARAAWMSARVQEMKSDAQEATVMTLDIMAHDLRTAGFSAKGVPVVAVRQASRSGVAIAADLNGDGDIDDASERVAYTYDQSKHALMRATGAGSPQPFVRDVAPDGVQFGFFDRQGSEIVPAADGVPAEALGRIHRIDVSLRVEITNPDPRVATPLWSAMSTSICLRNQ